MDARGSSANNHRNKRDFSQSTPAIDSLDLGDIQSACDQICIDDRQDTTYTAAAVDDDDDHSLAGNSIPVGGIADNKAGSGTHHSAADLKLTKDNCDKKLDSVIEPTADTGGGVIRPADICEENPQSRSAVNVSGSQSDRNLVNEIVPPFDLQEDKKIMQSWLSNSVKILLEHLNRYGMCVVDDFLGEDKGSAVLEEITMLQDTHSFQDGQVMSGGGLHEPSIRSDKITWTDGVTPYNAPALRHLIKLIDSIVLSANRVQNNGDLGKYKINGRTKIMVACYPGGGSHYVKHVDNPNRDGRVVTAIYYLNKDWNSETDGGSLKIYSQVNKGAVVKIEPMFDRVVFFWSDSRNPHEVLPSNKPRYAVTVWYLDEVEKKNYERNRLRKKRSNAEL